MKERKAFLLRLDPKLFDELERWAAADLRSINAQIEFLLAESVRKRRRDSKKKTSQEEKTEM